MVLNSTNCFSAGFLEKRNQLLDPKDKYNFSKVPNFGKGGYSDNSVYLLKTK